ncbi:hypothetical protein LX36DRAFT_485879 [Colletotrichum falcatum]|nr:hypothetical protein LX36DRAFT_485879 [Colletotrichum falcatum]
MGSLHKTGRASLSDNRCGGGLGAGRARPRRLPRGLRTLDEATSACLPASLGRSHFPRGGRCNRREPWSVVAFPGLGAGVGEATLQQPTAFVFSALVPSFSSTRRRRCSNLRGLYSTKECRYCCLRQGRVLEIARVPVN